MTQEERIQKAAENIAQNLYDYAKQEREPEYSRYDEGYLDAIEVQGSFLVKEGIEWALSHQWISVDDELPKESGWYLILNINSNEPDFADTCQFDVDKGYWYTDIGGQRLLHEITHWMEIPKMNKD